MLNFDELVEGFKESGLIEGDTVLVHSSYKSFGGVSGGPKTVIDALLHVLGEEGTLIMPTFNFDFCKGEAWDVRQTPSHMGILTELVRQNPESRRVFHPIYSFSVLGQRAEEFGSLRYTSSYGPDSLFAKLREGNGKIMVIGLSYNDSMTFFHHVEELEGVNYRYMKSFTGEVTNEQGQTSVETFTMLVRDLEQGVITAVDPMGAFLEEAGVITTQKIGGAQVKLMIADEVYTKTAAAMKEKPQLLYQLSNPEGSA
jgi:aminoglycoside 3-N-acetyltransferase